MATCSSSGLQYESFTVTSLALFGGAPCAFGNGTTRFSTCINSTTCPWADVQIPDSPPVLPPLTAPLNNTGVVIKGGNVTITGIKIEGVSGFSNGSSTGGITSSSFNVGSGGNSSGSADSSSNSKPLQPRVAAFNGSLGFYTLGLLVEVLGEFELARSMAWTWSSTWNAWTSQVGGLAEGCLVCCRQHRGMAAFSLQLASQVGH